MSNTASTTFRIYGTHADIHALASVMDEIYRIDGDYGNMAHNDIRKILYWLGYKDGEYPFDMPQGSVEYHTDKSCVIIDTETPWQMYAEPIQLLVQKVAPRMLVLYYSIELGCIGATTNDDDYYGGYYMEFEDLPDLEVIMNGNCAWVTFSEMQEICQRMFPELSFRKAMKTIEEQYQDEWRIYDVQFNELMPV